MQPLKQKVEYYQQLEPIVTELSRRNPFPQPEDQVPHVLGVWTPVWSTIPFQDMLPGRVSKQSYQIFIMMVFTSILPVMHLVIS